MLDSEVHWESQFGTERSVSNDRQHHSVTIICFQVKSRVSNLILTFPSYFFQVMFPSLLLPINWGKLQAWTQQDLGHHCMKSYVTLHWRVFSVIYKTVKLKLTESYKIDPLQTKEQPTSKPTTVYIVKSNFITNFHGLLRVSIFMYSSESAIFSFSVKRLLIKQIFRHNFNLVQGLYHFLNLQKNTRI